MRRKVGQILLVVLTGILFPYMIALAMFAEVGERTNNGRQLRLQDGSLLDAEDYLPGILASQITAAAPLEAKKAQAVLARTWLYRVFGDRRVISVEEVSGEAWSLSELCALWTEGSQEELEGLVQAVRDTSRQVGSYEGEWIIPLYHFVSAGQTRPDQSGCCPYLVSRECYYDLEAENFMTIQILSREELISRINQIAEDRQVSEEIQLKELVYELDEAGYVLSLQLGGQSFCGQELSEALGLSSCWFRLEEYSGEIRLIARGNGHGYGMSQWGACQMADEGKSYEQILQFFFPGITIIAE